MRFVEEYVPFSRTCTKSCIGLVGCRFFIGIPSLAMKIGVSDAPSRSAPRWIAYRPSPTHERKIGLEARDKTSFYKP